MQIARQILVEKDGLMADRLFEFHGLLIFEAALDLEDLPVPTPVFTVGGI